MTGVAAPKPSWPRLAIVLTVVLGILLAASCTMTILSLVSRQTAFNRCFVASTGGHAEVVMTTEQYKNAMDFCNGVTPLKR